MGKIGEKKLQKRNALMNSAYELFAKTGFDDTSIHAIAHNAGVAKGTFYLYFSDKEDIRDALIRRHTYILLRDACDSLRAHIDQTRVRPAVAEQFIYIIDYVIEHVIEDIALLKLISKNLTWGLYHTDHNNAIIKFQSDPDEIDQMNIDEYVHMLLQEDGTRLREPKLLIFTLMSLVSSTCYDLLMYKKPVMLSEYKPYMHRIVTLLVNDAVIPGTASQ